MKSPSLGPPNCAAEVLGRPATQAHALEVQAWDQNPPKTSKNIKNHEKKKVNFIEFHENMMKNEENMMKTWENG